jgi:hypothetical protein
VGGDARASRLSVGSCACATFVAGWVFGDISVFVIMGRSLGTDDVRTRDLRSRVQKSATIGRGFMLFGEGHKKTGRGRFSYCEELPTARLESFAAANASTMPGGLDAI